MNDVFPTANLNCFFEDELEHMICGMGEVWTVEMLTDCIKFDHGCASKLQAAIDPLSSLSAESVLKTVCILVFGNRSSNIEVLFQHCIAPCGTCFFIACVLAVQSRMVNEVFCTLGRYLPWK